MSSNAPEPRRWSLPAAASETDQDATGSKRWTLPAKIVEAETESQLDRLSQSSGVLCQKDEEQIVIVTPPAKNKNYSRRQKLFLVWLVSASAIFSPLSSNIYFPALVTIAEFFNTTNSVIALSVTIYMIFQGIAPSFWGPLADTYGRRPILIATLIIYIVANAALSQAEKTWVLMVFRGLQAVGSSSTIALGSGVIGDISIASERGGLLGIFSGVRMMGQAVGPVIGGALGHYLGFRSIFFFLLGFAMFVVVLLVLVLPETLPKIAGTGDVILKGVYRPVFFKKDKRTEEMNFVAGGLSFRPFLESFKMLAEKDVFVTLFFGGIIYTVWSMMTSSTTALFEEEYFLNDVQVGLVYLPNGIGCVLGSYLTGRLLDIDYFKTEQEYCKEHNIVSMPKDTATENLPKFPIVRARLRSIWPIVGLFIAATGAYGWTVEYHIAIPLTLQFIIAFTATTVFTINSTLLIDLYPSRPATATAINNLMRCSMGALGVGVIEKLIETIKEGPTFSILGGVSLLSSGLLVVQWKHGEKWIEQRASREQDTS